MILDVAHLGTVESHITDVIQEDVNCDFFHHHQRIKDKVWRGVTRISVPWWWKRKNESLGEGHKEKLHQVV